MTGYINIKGKNKYIDELEEQLREEGFDFDAHHSSPINDNTIQLEGERKKLFRWCHPIKSAELNANLPTHRKHFLRKAREVLNEEE